MGTTSHLITAEVDACGGSMERYVKTNYLDYFHNILIQLDPKFNQTRFKQYYQFFKIYVSNTTSVRFLYTFFKIVMYIYYLYFIVYTTYVFRVLTNEGTSLPLLVIITL